MRSQLWIPAHHGALAEVHCSILLGEKMSPGPVGGSLASQLTRPGVKRSPLTAAYLLPNWARFFRVERDRSVAAADATIADRIQWSRCSVKKHAE